MAEAAVTLKLSPGELAVIQDSLLRTSQDRAADYATRTKASTLLRKVS